MSEQEQTSPAEPLPGPSSRPPPPQRENSTTTPTPSSDRPRLASLLEPPHITALNMIQEWARNLHHHASQQQQQQQQQGAEPHPPTPGGEGETATPTSPTPAPPTATLSLSSLPSRLARGILLPPALTAAQQLQQQQQQQQLQSNRRRSSAATPGAGEQRLEEEGGGSGGGAAGRSHLTLDIEGGGGGGGDEGAAEEEGAGGGGGGSEPGSPSGDLLRDSPETRAFIEQINQYTTLRPFLIIMLLKNLVDHGSGIVAFCALLVTFSHANSLLKKEVGKQRKRNLLFLLMIVVNLVGCAAFVYYVFSEEELYLALGFMSTKLEREAETGSFLLLLWVVGVTDYVAKFLGIVVKAGVVALPNLVVPFQMRGIYYLFIEQSVQLYRSFLPIPHWLIYLVNSYQGNMRLFGFFLAGMYVFFKIMDSVGRVRDWEAAFRKLFQNVHYGTAVSAKELESLDSLTCPICHDTFSSPTRLSCSHVFCEECVSTWFDRGMTCPMCRAKVVDDPTYRDGSTAQYIQLF